MNEKFDQSNHDFESFTKVESTMLYYEALLIAMGVPEADVIKCVNKSLSFCMKGPQNADHVIKTFENF